MALNVNPGPLGQKIQDKSDMQFHSKSQTTIHFVGIGGIGMSGIAEVFLSQGYPVSGSDQAESESVRRLKNLGAHITLGHQADSVHGSSVVVISSAVRPDNPEVIEAKRLRIPVIPRAEMLGELMRGRTGVAVAGTHGKTTTTSLLSMVLVEAGLDPTLVIGGKVDLLGGNAKLGQGSLLVAEADESDGSFLTLPASFAIVTNIDNDHLDHYKSLQAIEDAFVSFVGKLPFYGMAAVCGDDPGVRRVLERFSKPIQTYGFSDEWDLIARNLQPHGMGVSFSVFRREAPGLEHRELGQIVLAVPGKHNVLNALATVCISLRLGISFEIVAKGLARYGGVKRRFEKRWEDRAANRLILDDYGHHPTEIAATLAAARSVWPGKITCIFQPHRYSRTLHCHDGFLSAFHHADRLLLTDIYSAGEDPIQGVTSFGLAQDIRQVAKPGQVIEYISELSSIAEYISKDFSKNELVICMGAGTITRLPDQIIQRMVPGSE
jgi:UDP-N-acetylmuramate--alanine ligase